MVFINPLNVTIFNSSSDLRLESLWAIDLFSNPSLDREFFFKFYF